MTGSNIPSAAEVGTNPVQTFDRDSINKSGERTVEQFLRNLPVANANGVPVSNNENGSNTAVGAAAIALRGFDSRATLVLLDGRRVAPYPTGNNPGSVNAMFVDLNSIPQAAIESIEILKDGASTTYGADAVAGVVNLKMRHNYDGAEASVEYGNTTDKDSGLLSSSVIYGVGNKTTEIAGVVNFYHRNSIANRDRSFSAVPPFLSSNASPYNLQLSNAPWRARLVDSLPERYRHEFATPPEVPNGSDSCQRVSIRRPTRIRPGANGFNFNQFSLSFPSTERYGGYTHFEHKFFEDQMVVYGDMMYQNVQSHNELAAPATGSFQTAGQVTLAIPPSRRTAPASHAIWRPDLRRDRGDARTRSIPLTRSIKSSPAAAGRVWPSLAIVCSTTKPTHFSARSASKATSCSMAPGDTTPDFATAR